MFASDEDRKVKNVRCVAKHVKFGKKTLKS